MAKKNEASKHRAVRAFLKTNNKATNQQVVDALSKKGITVSANQVGDIKATHNKRQQARRKVVAEGGVGIPELKAALAFLKVTGSIAAATQALKVAQEIRDIV